MQFIAVCTPSNITALLMGSVASSGVIPIGDLVDLIPEDQRLSHDEIEEEIAQFMAYTDRLV